MKNALASRKLVLYALACVQFLGMAWSLFGAGVGRTVLHGHVPAVVAHLTPQGPLPADTNLSLSIGLPLRNQAELSDFLGQLQNPQSPNYHKYLTPQEFTARFGPTEQQYQTVVQFAESYGLIVVRTHPNRVVLDVEGSVSNIERAFQITLRLYRHPTESRDFFAPNAEPSVPVSVPVVDIEGLSDFSRPHPLLYPAKASLATPLGGSGPNGYYAGKDFRNAYVPGTTLTGAGQTVGLLEFSDYYKSDITNYENTIGMTNYVPLNNVVVGTGKHPSPPSTANNAEVALDIEVAIAMAPGLSQVIVYESSGSASSLLSQMANDNLANQLSSSWTWSGGPDAAIDAILKQMAAQGQSFFQASGDSDAYTGANMLDDSTLAVAPVDSTNLTCVGGTTLTMSGSGVAWSSEKVWNYHSYGGPDADVGSGGGISTYYTIPSWQAGVSMASNSGSTVWRNIPDVALTADQIYVAYNNGSSGGFAGTSCAAPLWAGFCALVNQSSVTASSNPTNTVGFLNPALYAIANSSNYANCFHDITTGNNIGTNTPGLFNAVSGYDLCTGLGTPNGTNLINALVPYPSIASQPISQTATNGNTVTFTVLASGQTPLSYQWFFGGTALVNGGNVSGATTSALKLTSVTTNDDGNYSVVVQNSYGSVTSSVATLTVVYPPSFTSQPVSQTVPTGGNATFSATVSGAAPLAYQWRQGSANLVNGGNVSGATSNVMTLTAITLSDAGNYTLVATNVYGSATSSVATLTVTEPPTISSPPSPQTVQCGSNATFSVTATGTTPLYYQWSLDGAIIPGATSTNLSLIDVHLPDHTVTVVVTNLYGSATSSVTLTVQDTLPPAIMLTGGNPLYVELGSAFTDPGATAYDACAGVVPVSVSGTVNTNTVGTNTLTYTAADGNGNTNTAARSVIVRDTTPPTIQWSFTNLVLVADTNCSALLPDLTGTNDIQATDLSLPLTITQSPTNGTALSEGTNQVLLTVLDAYGNAAYSTNTVFVQDQTPPVITLTGGSPLYVELGSTFTDPGATAYDACAGAVPVSVSGTVNTSLVGTNTLTYTATDGHGNTNTMPRNVIVRDTTPPTIQWSFTNLVLAADTNCSAVLPDLTGTNYIQATDLSLPLTITQNPTNGTVLSLSTNTVVLGVMDAYGNAAYSTNTVLVQDQTPPLITLTGGNPLYVELGSAFTDPGATAYDACAGAVPVSVSGTVNTNAVGTNTLTYTATDGHGNTNTMPRSVIVRDTTPPTIQWSFTNLVLGAGTNCTATLPDLTGTNDIQATDLSLPLTISQNPTNGTVLPEGTNEVVLTVLDAYDNAAYSTNTVFVEDQTPPVITLTGGSPLYVELGSTFTDPGATAYDACAGIVSVTVSGTVNTSLVGTNTLTYTATDGHGNTNTTARSVVVRDTTPPTIQWCFTNLVLGAGTNCTATLPDLTGTNDIQATDLSLPLTISQSPTNGTILSLSTNTVVLAVMDAYGNTTYSTNTVRVQDQTPPVIWSQPSSQTNDAGTGVSFGVAATACTPLAFQWYFNNFVLAGQTNSTLTLTNLNSTLAGNYFVTATAAGGSSTSTVAVLAVKLLSSSITLASSSDPSGFKDAIHFIGTVTPTNATGSLRFVTNSVAFDTASLVGGTATSVTNNTLPRGTNVIQAVYSGSTTYLPATNTLAQIVTNHPPVASAFFTNRYAGFPLYIPMADLAANWSDPDGDVVSLTAIGISTNGVTVTNEAGTLTYVNSNDVDDAFVCTISDGWGGTNYQTITVTVVPLPSNATPAITSVSSSTNNTILLDLSGSPGFTYILETITNLAMPGSWAPIATNTLGTNGVWQFSDTVTNNGQRFYRLKLAR